jgi:flagellar hook-associated protein 3 FlgL
VRVTHGFSSRTLLDSIQRSLRSIDRAQAEIATGRRVRTPSDDPVAAADILRASSELRAIEQHRRGATAARTRLIVEESALNQVGDVLTRARELAVSQAGATATAGTRQAAAAEVQRLLETVTGLANTRLGGTYLFGGDKIDQPPVSPTGELAADLGSSGEVEIAPGMRLTPAHNAEEIFGHTGTVQSLRRLLQGLEAGDAAAIAESTGEIESAFAGIQKLLAEVGARSNHVDAIAEQMETADFQLRVQRSELQDADLESALIQLASRQSALQATLLTTSRVLDMNLTNYLR